MAPITHPADVNGARSGARAEEPRPDLRAPAGHCSRQPACWRAPARVRGGVIRSSSARLISASRVVQAAGAKRRDRYRKLPARPANERRTHHGNLDPRSQFLPLPAHGNEGRTRDAGLRRRLRSRSQDARRHRRGRCRSQVEVLLADHRYHGDAERRRRAAPFRLERLLLVPVPQRAARSRRAPLPGGAGPQVLAHPHPRHQARSEEAEDRQGDRARRGGGEGRLHAPAHGALRAGGHLRRSARQPRGQGPRRRVPDGPRDLRRARPVGDGSRARSTSPTTPGGTSATTRSSPASGARPTPSRTG